MKRSMRGGPRRSAAVRGVRDRGKIFVVKVEWEASVDIDHFTAECIRTRVGSEGLGRTLPSPFVPRVSAGLRRVVIKEHNQSSKL